MEREPYGTSRLKRIGTIRAIVGLHDALADAKLEACMLLQVHDKLLFEVPTAEVDETVKVVKSVMERAP